MAECSWFRTKIAFVHCAVLAGWLGLLQSIIMFILAVLAVEYVTREWEEKWDKWHIDHPKNYSSLPNGIFYVDFLVDGYGRYTTLYYCILIYLPLAFIWFISSILVLCTAHTPGDIHRGRGWAYFVFESWSIVTFVVCITHIVVGCLLIQDQIDFLANPVRIPSKPTTIAPKIKAPRKGFKIQDNQNGSFEGEMTTKKFGRPLYDVLYRTKGLWKSTRITTGSPFPPEDSTDDPGVMKQKRWFLSKWLWGRNNKDHLNKNITHPRVFEEGNPLKGVFRDDSVSKGNTNVPTTTTTTTTTTTECTCSVDEPEIPTTPTTTSPTTTTTTTPEPTWMAWTHTIAQDHDKAIDEGHVKVLFYLLGLIFGYSILWLVNFILASLLLVTSFGPTECFGGPDTRCGCCPGGYRFQ